MITGREQGRSKHFKKKYGAGGVTQWKAVGLVYMRTLGLHLQHYKNLNRDEKGKVSLYQMKINLNARMCDTQIIADHTLMAKLGRT